MTNKNGFTTVSINSSLIEKIDKIFKKKGFPTRASYIHYKLRSAVEKDERKIIKI